MKLTVSRRELAWLAAILAAAVVLRFWGIKYGLPFLYIKDEYHEVMRAMQLGAGSFNYERTGKGGLYYLLFVEYGIYFVVSKALGIVGSAKEFGEQFARDPTNFYLMGRVTVALFGVGTIAMVFLFARRAYGLTAGLLSAAFLAVNVLHVELSKSVRIDVVMTFFVMASLLAAISMAERGSKRSYLAAAILAALAVTTKISAILIVVPLLLAHAYAVRMAGGGAASILIGGKAWLAAIVFLGIWFGTDPGMVFALTDYLDLFNTGDSGSAIGIGAEDELRVTERPNLFLYYADVFRRSMGWPLFLLAMLGIAYGAWRRSTADVLVISLGALTYIVMSSTTSEMYFPRYVLPALPLLSMLAGRVLADIMETLPTSTHWISVPLVAAALIWSPTNQALERSAILTRKDTRTLAKEWIEVNIPRGAKVFIEGAKIAPVRDTVPLRDTAENIRKRIEFWSQREPRQAEYLRYQLDAIAGRTFRLELVGIGEEDELEAYRRAGVEFFVIVPEKIYSGRRSTSKTVRLYEDLKAATDVRLLAIFQEEPSVRPGPTVEVYEVIGKTG